MYYYIDSLLLETYIIFKIFDDVARAWRARARHRRHHIPTFGRFCRKNIFCRKLSEIMF